MKDKLLALLNTILINNDLKPIEALEHDLKLQNDLGMDSIILAELTVRDRKSVV